VCNVLVYGSETWALKVGDVQRMVSTERMTVRWMCGVSLKDRRSSKELLDCMGTVGIAELMKRGPTTWRGRILGNRPTSVCVETRTLNVDDDDDAYGH
jgi:hypothetical protein